MTSPDDPFRKTDPAPYGQTGQPAASGQPYGQPPAYGQPYGQHDQPVGPPRNGFGTAALVLGILALLGAITGFVGLVLGALAIIFGVLGRGRAKRREATNGGAATAGLVLGVISVVLSAVLLVAVGSFLFSDTGQELTDCLADAGQDAAAQQQCQLELEESLTS